MYSAYHTSLYSSTTFIANRQIKQIATRHQLKQIPILNTPAMLYNHMRQMQMLLFACFGVSPTQSLALASLTNPSCTRRKRHKIAENSTLLPVSGNSMCLTPRKLRYVTAPPISTRELVLVRLGCMCRWTPLSPGRLASDSTLVDE